MSSNIKTARPREIESRLIVFGYYLNLCFTLRYTEKKTVSQTAKDARKVDPAQYPILATGYSMGLHGTIWKKNSGFVYRYLIGTWYRRDDVL